MSIQTRDLTLVPRSALSALDAVGVPYTVVGADPDATLLGFDHSALDELARILRLPVEDDAESDAPPPAPPEIHAGGGPVGRLVARLGLAGAA